MTIKSGKIEDRWYKLQYFKEGKWREWEMWETETRRECRREMVLVNFMGERVRMVEHFHGYRPIGKVVKFGYFGRKRKKAKKVVKAEGGVK